MKNLPIQLKSSYIFLIVKNNGRYVIYAKKFYESWCLFLFWTVQCVEYVHFEVIDSTKKSFFFFQSENLSKISWSNHFAASHFYPLSYLLPLKNLVKNLRFSVEKFKISSKKKKKSSSLSEFFPCCSQDQKFLHKKF